MLRRVRINMPREVAHRELGQRRQVLAGAEVRVDHVVEVGHEARGRAGEGVEVLGDDGGGARAEAEDAAGEVGD